jgi:hypothetical protein
MAGDWIQMRVNLDTDPAVLEMAARLNIEECVVVGRLWKLWSWADQHVTDNYNIAVTRTAIDRIVGLSGFADAMCATTWLCGEDNAMQMPNLERYQGNNAKKRASDREKAARYRHRKRHLAVTTSSPSRHHSVTTESPEKTQRREEKNSTPVVPKGDMAADQDFADFWETYPRKENKKAAYKAWRQTAAARPPIEVLIAAVLEFKDCDQWVRDSGKFIPHAATWLNAHRWVEVLPSELSENPEKKEKGGGAPDDPPDELWRPRFDAKRGGSDFAWHPADFAELKRDYPDIAQELSDELQAEGLWPKEAA